MPYWPVAVVADGCSTNVCAGEKLVEKYGMVSPNMRCAAHAADGCLKRLANSKTMCVVEVSEFLPYFRKIMKHFALSGKSSSALNDTLAVLHMRKVHMITFCPTRMCYLLTACALSVSLFVPICNVLVSLAIKKEQRDYFLSPKCMFIIHILADIETTFKKNFLKTLDTDNGIIIDTFRVNMEYAELLPSLEFPLLSRFLEGLQFDDNGNLSVLVPITADNIHDINLNFNHRPSRGVDNRLEKLKEEAEELKKKIVVNMIDNVNDQAQGDTLIEYASAFDMHRKILDLDQRLVYIEKLGDIYCKEYVHNVKEEDDYWGGYQISIKYPKKIDCTPENLVSEMRSLWPACNKIWPEFCGNKKSGNLEFWQKMLSLYFVTHPNICNLVKILKSISPGTGPLERSYSKLAKLCYKDRNKLLSENIEVQYLISQLNNFSFDYEAARLLMEK